MNKIDLSKPYHWFYLFLCFLTIFVVIGSLFFFFAGGFFLLLFWTYIMCQAWEPIEQDWRERNQPS